MLASVCCSIFCKSLSKFNMVANENFFSDVSMKVSHDAASILCSALGKWGK